MSSQEGEEKNKTNRFINLTPHDLTIIKQPEEWVDKETPEVEFVIKPYDNKEVRCTASGKRTYSSFNIVPEGQTSQKNVLITSAPVYDALVDMPTLKDANGNECPLNDSDVVFASMPVGNMAVSNPSLFNCTVMGPNTNPTSVVEFNGKKLTSGVCRNTKEGPDKGKIIGCYDFVVYQRMGQFSSL